MQNLTMKIQSGVLILALAFRFSSSFFFKFQVIDSITNMLATIVSTLLFFITASVISYYWRTSIRAVYSILVILTFVKYLILDQNTNAVLAGVIAGGVDGTSLLVLGSAFSFTSVERARKNILLGFGGAALVIPAFHALTAIDNAQIQRTSFAIYLVLITIFVLLLKDNIEPFQSVKETVSKYRGKRGKWLWALMPSGPKAVVLAVILILFVVSGLFQGYYLSKGIWFVTYDIVTYTILVVTSILYISNKNRGVKEWFDITFLVVLIAYILSFFAALVVADLPLLVLGIIGAGVVILHIPIWILLAEVSIEQSISPVFIFGSFTSILFSSSMAGRLLALLLVNKYGFEYSYISKIAAGALAIITITVVALLIPNMKKREVNLEEPVQTSSGSDHEREHFDAFCRQHGLSEKECNVIHLYAQGRSVPFISSKYFLSESAVKSHIRRVYAKLDVHTRQELLDIIGGSSALEVSTSEMPGSPRS